MKKLKATYLLLFTILFVFSSCKKSINNVHFHGRVLFACNGQPATNISCAIGVVWDSGHQGGSNVCGVTTDNNGYYSIVSDVSYHGDIQYYDLIVYPDSTCALGVGGRHDATNDKDILMNGTAYTCEHLSFHIKNISPYDNNDILDTLEVVSDSSGFPNPVYGIAFNLRGPNVDTIIAEVIGDDRSYFIYKYSFTKNNLRTLKYDTVNTTCYGLTNKNVFY